MSTCWKSGKFMHLTHSDTVCGFPDELCFDPKKHEYGRPPEHLEKTVNRLKAGKFDCAAEMRGNYSRFYAICSRAPSSSRFCYTSTGIFFLKIWVEFKNVQPQYWRLVSPQRLFLINKRCGTNRRNNQLSGLCLKLFVYAHLGEPEKKLRIFHRGLRGLTVKFPRIVIPPHGGDGNKTVGERAREKVVFKCGALTNWMNNLTLCVFSGARVKTYNLSMQICSSAGTS